MRAFLSRSRFAFASVLLFANASYAEPPADGAQTVSANVGPLRALQGSVACRLYKSPTGFPYTSNDTVTVREKVLATTVRCSFEKLPPGIYAILVIHDENDNHKLDKNRLGMPIEGYGASNNHTHAFMPPSWEESKFVVERGKDRELAIAVRY
jgi:uncharacterized protein (DUF2141 family)